MMYDGMKCNATNGNETFAGMKYVFFSDSSFLVCWLSSFFLLAFCFDESGD